MGDVADVDDVASGDVGNVGEVAVADGEVLNIWERNSGGLSCWSLAGGFPVLNTVVVTSASPPEGITVVRLVVTLDATGARSVPSSIRASVVVSSFWTSGSSSPVVTIVVFVTALRTTLELPMTVAFSQPAGSDVIGLLLISILISLVGSSGSGMVR